MAIFGSFARSSWLSEAGNSGVSLWAQSGPQRWPSSLPFSELVSEAVKDSSEGVGWKTGRNVAGESGRSEKVPYAPFPFAALGNRASVAADGAAATMGAVTGLAGSSEMWIAT